MCVVARNQLTSVTVVESESISNLYILTRVPNVYVWQTESPNQ